MKKTLLLVFLLLLFKSTLFAQQPTVLSFSPTTTTTGVTVRINGINISNATAVSFGGVAAASFTTGIDTIQYINAVVGSGASGSVSVTTPAGTAAKTGFTYTAPAGSPSISTFSPATAGSGATVVIQGSNLNTVTAVSFGGTPAASFSIVQDTSIRINAVVGSGSSGSVSVTNNVGTATKTGFIYTAPAGSPSIFAFSPTTAASGNTVVIEGSNLNNVTTVSFGGTPAASFTIVQDTSIRINAVVGSGSSGNVSVTNSVGTSSKGGFTYTAPAGAPSISSFSPTTATGGATVVIQGSNLSSVTAVSFGGTPAASFSVVSDTSVRINAVVGSGSSGNVSVTNNVSSASKAGFTYVSTSPTVSSFSPLSGTIGTSVVITGSNLSGATSVRFSNVSASFTLNSATQITAVVPAGASSGIITITTPQGMASSSSNFLVNTSASSVVKVCPNGNAILTSNITGSTYQWQVLVDTGYSNLVNGANYSGVNSVDLQLIAVPTTWYGKKYRCIVNNASVSNVITIQISNSWSGTNNSSWETGANWGCSQTVPDSNTDVVISSGTVTLNSNTTVKSIILSPGANLVVAPGFTLTILKQ